MATAVTAAETCLGILYPVMGLPPPLWGAAGFDFTILTTWCDASRWLLGAFLALMIAMMMYFDDVDKYY